jgi:hypothetical protein
VWSSTAQSNERKDTRQHTAASPCGDSWVILFTNGQQRDDSLHSTLRNDALHQLICAKCGAAAAAVAAVEKQ